MKRRSLLAVLGLTTLRAQQTDPAKLTLATFNIRFPSEDDGPNRWEHRRASFFDTWRRLDADLVGVQEAFASQLQEIDVEFGQYQRIGVGRDDGKEAGEFSALLFRESRLEKLAGGTFWLSDTPESVASNTWEAACTRVCTWGRFRDKKSGKHLAVFNSHWDHQSARAKEKSPVTLAREIGRLAKPGDALVVMGDFNSRPSSLPVRYLLGEKVTLDAKEETCPLTLRNTLTEPPMGQRATFHGWKGTAAGEQIDYILLGPEFTAATGQILRWRKEERWPSDHYPVRTEASL